MKHKKLLVIILGISIVLIDQVLKGLLVEQNFEIIPNILNITYTKNTGMAFGIGKSNLYIIIIVNIIIIGAVIKILIDRGKHLDLKTLISLLLILSGGIGNLIDRLFRGYVIDYIDINILDFPNFNIADISIALGIALLIIYIIKTMLSDKNKCK